jgi:bifunctional enzyme CysN/CysC
MLADSFEAMVFWMNDQPMLPGRTYLLCAGTSTISATIAPLKYRLDLPSLEHVAANKLERHEVGICAVELGEPIVFDPEVKTNRTRGVVFLDPTTREPIGAGLIRFALRRSQNVRWQELDIDKTARAVAKRQRPCVIWLTGLPGAGKSTIANLVERKLHGRGCHTYLLDGDNVRRGLNKDLGFTDADRVENIRRVAEVARLMLDAGLIVIVAFISPFAEEREMARRLVAEGEFFEVFVDAPLELAEQRDPKGLYKKARSGELANFTGIDSPYERPERPALRVDTAALSAEDAADSIIALLEEHRVLAG